MWLYVPVPVRALKRHVRIVFLLSSQQENKQSTVEFHGVDTRSCNLNCALWSSWDRSILRGEGHESIDAMPKPTPSCLILYLSVYLEKYYVSHCFSLFSELTSVISHLETLIER